MELERALHLYGDYCLRIAYTYTKNLQEAEEIVQDVFYQFNEEKFRGESSIKTYLVKMTVNKSHDYLRKFSRRSRILFERFLPNEKQKIVTYDNYQIEMSNISQQVLELPVNYREVIILHYYDDYKFVEIAKVLGISLNTVKTRHFRAKQLLKKQCMEVELDDEME